MATYYIDPDTGTGTGDGSTGDPFATWLEAKTAGILIAGNTTKQKRGTTDQLLARFEISANGSVGNEIILDAYYNSDGTDDVTQPLPIIRGADGIETFYLNSRHDYIFNNIRVVGVNETAFRAVTAFANVYNLTWNNCEFHTTGVSLIGDTRPMELTRTIGRHIYEFEWDNCSFTTDNGYEGDYNSIRIIDNGPPFFDPATSAISATGSPTTVTIASTTFADGDTVVFKDVVTTGEDIVTGSPYIVTKLSDTQFTIDANVTGVSDAIGTALIGTKIPIYGFRWNECSWTGNLSGPRFYDSFTDNAWLWHRSDGADNRPYGIVIENCSFIDMIGPACKLVTGSKHVDGYESYFDNNTIINMGDLVNSVYLNAVQTHHNDRFRISNNYISGVLTTLPDGHGIILDQANGMGADTQTTNCLVYGNYIAGCSSTNDTAAISSFHARDNKIFSNIFVSNGTGYKNVHTESTGNEVYNNIIDGNVRGIQIQDYFISATAAAPVIEQNNIIINNDVGLSIQHSGLYSDHINSYNVFYNNTLDTTDSDVLGVGSITVDPLLDSTYIPATSSPCYHAGTTVAFNLKDYKGHKFNTPPTIGAYEFTSRSVAKSGRTW